jgi:hypothetical protein
VETAFHEVGRDSQGRADLAVFQPGAVFESDEVLMSGAQLIEDETEEIGVLAPILHLLSVHELFKVNILNGDGPRPFSQELIHAIPADAEEPRTKAFWIPEMPDVDECLQPGFLDDFLGIGSVRQPGEDKGIDLRLVAIHDPRERT